MSDRDHVRELEIPVRTYNALSRAGVVSIAALMAMSDLDRLAIPGIGRGGLADIEQALAQHVDESMGALLAGRLPHPPAPDAPADAATGAGDEHPIERARIALLEAADLAPNDGYSGWRATLSRMAEALPKPEWLEGDR
ncbi:MAG: Bacterial polymerase, alpha chain terminal domain [Gaiellales bacterium]|nr:Bacterial polymerase, alpha chain terminal domain [Gaiellales bacterium]MEA2168278.1 Bacterial polymerase, alpha chain terminal domain [Solirubrobacteraceae bacterium]